MVDMWNKTNKSVAGVKRWKQITYILPPKIGLDLDS